MAVAVCGPPGAGKSTLAERSRARLAARGYDVRLARSDDYRRRTYERLAAQVREEPGDWLVDGTFYKPEFQERFRALGARFVLVTASLETCLARNRAREDPISERGLRVVHAEFAEPDPDLVLDTDRLSAAAGTALLADRVAGWIRSDRLATDRS